MKTSYIGIIVSILFILPIEVSAKPSDSEAQLNTANTIRAAFELRKLAESLAPGVDTRCYIAKLASYEAESLPEAAKVISEHPSSNRQADRFAIQSTIETMEIYRKHLVEKIANDCRKNS